MTQDRSEFVDIAAHELLRRVRGMKNEGWKLCQICATTREDGLELLYSLDREAEMMNLRLILGADEAVDSVGDIFPYAFMYENEMKDLFGLKVLNLAVDFQGHLYKTAVPTPFNARPNQEGQ